MTESTGTQKWPERIWIVRHGESAGNVARNHGLAGQRLSERVGPLGFLAREILADIPAVMATFLVPSS